MRSVLALVAMAAVAAAAPVVQWTRVGRAAPTETVEFSVALKEKNLDVLENILVAVSDPYSPYYGQHPTMEALNELTLPSQEVYAKVRRVVEKSGASCTPRGPALRCRSTVAQVEDLLATKLTTFQHPVTGDKAHRIAEGESARIPAAIRDVVQFFTGLVGMPVERLGRMRVSAPAADLVVVPQTIVGIYNLTGVTGNAQSTQAPAEFQSYQSYRPVDLNKFIAQTAVTNFTVANKVGPFQPSSGALESALDIQYIGAVGVGNTNWYWTETQWMYDFASTITTSGTATPNIFSMSWGWYEGDQCQVGSDGPCGSGGTSYDYVAAVNALFAKAGAAGITVLAASGDSGAHGRTDPTCKSAVTRPDYPAASQYVTTVGATQLINGVQGGNSPICSTGGSYAGQCAIGGTEVVCSPATGALISSGGGFSNVAPMPSWVQTAQQAYQKISGAVPPAADYNASGSGYPDVAALGHNYYIQAGGAVLVDGTSCSSPVFAGILGLINAQLLSAGKSKLGFFNPLLYQIGAKYPNAFQDITVGNNYCTEESCSCTTGYKAAPGWDATTGWGTPNYPNLLAAVKAIGLEREMRLKH